MSKLFKLTYIMHVIKCLVTSYVADNICGETLQNPIFATKPQFCPHGDLNLRGQVWDTVAKPCKTPFLPPNPSFAPMGI